MEKLQGSINSCLLEENLDVGCLVEEETAAAALVLSDANLLLDSTHSNLKFDQQEIHEEQGPNCGFSPPNIYDRIPFLQMLQSAEPPLQQTEEANFHHLLSLQQQQQYQQQIIKKLQQQLRVPWESHDCNNYLASTEQQQLESCVTNLDMMGFAASPVKSEVQIQPLADTSVENLILSPEYCNQEMTYQGYDHHLRQSARSSKRYKFAFGRSGQGRISKHDAPNLAKSPPPATGERKKRKRRRTLKNKEEAESQRMTHIAVERNRRRQMNDHLNALRCLMPPSYVQRGDQASIVGGAIDFVKELEQLLKSLEAQKRMRQADENNVNGGSGGRGAGAASSSSSSTSSSVQVDNLLMGSSFSERRQQQHGDGGGRREELAMGMRRSGAGEVQAVVIQNHVNVKVEWRWERSGQVQGQLVKVALALEDLRLTVLHLNITSFHCFVHYSLNLKIEDDCNLRSAEEIAAGVHEIFSLINGS